MPTRASIHLRTALACGAILALGLAAETPAVAQTSVMPSAKAVIYPGDVIDDEMLADISAQADGADGPFAQSRSELIGKMARRTLLPGRAIPLRAIDNPRVVRSGAEVQIIYVEGGLTIVTAGAALQDGGVGDVVKIRNSDSGVTVIGTVRPDGAVQVNGG
jgi:flagellar basal body P-ring formation protein FlgA